MKLSWLLGHFAAEACCFPKHPFYFFVNASVCNAPACACETRFREFRWTQLWADYQGADFIEEGFECFEEEVIEEDEEAS